MRAAAASRAVLVGGRPKMLREMPRPLYVSHRVGGSTGQGPYPENTAESMEFLLADGGRAMNYDGLSITSDGVVVNEHDTTVDRTKNGTGTISAMTLAAYKALKQRPSASYGPSSFPDDTWGTHTFDEMVAQLGARAVHHPECNISGQASFYGNCYLSRGLKDYVQIETGNITNANALVAMGIPVTWLNGDGTTVATTQSQWPNTQGPVGINYYQASPPGGSIDAYIRALVTAGYKVQVFSINRKSDADQAIASAAAAGGVLDAVISNDPIYMDRRIWKPRTSDSFATGRYGHGFVAGAGGNIPRAGFYPANRVGFGNDFTAGVIWYLLGELSPLNRPFTLTFETVVEGLTSLGSAVVSGPITVVDQNYAVSGTGRHDGYYWSYNLTTGVMLVQKNTGSGATQASVGQKTTAIAVMPLKLTADLTAGVAVTSLPVRAVPASIPTGMQFLLPTGQKAITSGVTAANATSVTVTSITPSALVPTGTRLPQTIPMSLQFTATQMIFKRTDTNDSFTSTESTFGTELYPFFGRQANGSTVSFTDGVTTAGSPVVTSPALAAFVLSTDEDKLLTHANIPAGTRILSVDSATQVTLTANATASGSGLTMTLYRLNPGVSYRNINVGP